MASLPKWPLKSVNFTILNFTKTPRGTEIPNFKNWYFQYSLSKFIHFWFVHLRNIKTLPKLQETRKRWFLFYGPSKM